MKIKTNNGTYQPSRVEVRIITNEYHTFKSYDLFFDQNGVKNADYLCLHDRDIISIEK